MLALVVLVVVPLPHSSHTHSHSHSHSSNSNANAVNSTRPADFAVKTDPSCTCGDKAAVAVAVAAVAVAVAGAGAGLAVVAVAPAQGAADRRKTWRWWHRLYLMCARLDRWSQPRLCCSGVSRLRLCLRGTSALAHSRRDLHSSSSSLPSPSAPSTKLRDRHFMDAPASPVPPKVIRDLYHSDQDHLSADEQLVKARLRLVCSVLAVRKRRAGLSPRQAYHIAALAAKQTHSHAPRDEAHRLAEQEPAEQRKFDAMCSSMH